jgi:hypothetical protein
LEQAYWLRKGSKKKLVSVRFPRKKKKKSSEEPSGSKKKEMTKTKKTTTLQLCVDNNFPYPRIYSRAKNKKTKQKTKKQKEFRNSAWPQNPLKAQSKQRLLLV